MADSGGPVRVSLTEHSFNRRLRDFMSHNSDNHNFCLDNVHCHVSCLARGGLTITRLSSLRKCISFPFRLLTCPVKSLTLNIIYVLPVNQETIFNVGSSSFSTLMANQFFLMTNGQFRLSHPIQRCCINTRLRCHFWGIVVCLRLAGRIYTFTYYNFRTFLNCPGNGNLGFPFSEP